MKKTVLVTGSSSGIGAATASVFAAQGWNVIATMRSPSDTIAHGELGPNSLVVRLDVQLRGSIAQAIDTGITRFGGIDALVNCAGYGQYGIFEVVPREKIQKQFEVNVFGVMDVTRALLPHFRRKRGGTIVNVSALGGRIGLPMSSIYCASKHALEGFSEALFHELAPLNIAVKLVEPYGGVADTSFVSRARSEMTVDVPFKEYDTVMRRVMGTFEIMGAAPARTAEDVAQAVYNAATDEARRLRYPVGEDCMGFRNARLELPEEDAVEYVGSRFRDG